jgi:hypothetical protein
MNGKCLTVLLISCGSYSQPCGAEPPARETDARISYYLDSRDFNTATLVASTKALPLGMAVWGFADFHSAPERSSERFDMTRYFIEYRLLRTIEPGWVGGLQGLGLVAEYNDLEGDNNALVRFGLSYKRPLPCGRVQVRLFPLETDGNGGQLAFSYRVDFSHRLSLAGFADYSLVEGGADRWVAEPQLGYRLNDRFSLLLEYRYNEFEQNDSGVAAGLETLF